MRQKHDASLKTGIPSADDANMPRSPQRIVAVTGAVTILLLAIVAVALLSSRAQSRSDLESNFDQRAKIGRAHV